MIRWIAIVAALVGAAGVGLGAYAAHGLESKLVSDGLSPDEVVKKLHTCEIAVRYHLVHAVALLALSAAPAGFAPKRRGLVAVLWLIGLALFCGILYAQAIARLQGLNHIVPIGGLSFILGWLSIAAIAATESPFAPRK
ncbi:MAG: DUF423 domain-containing protein [Aureliella sp.]|jgi:uncharacterized membrane protein YgdD (TMEM256/DUF423 family)